MIYQLLSPTAEKKAPIFIEGPEIDIEKEFQNWYEENILLPTVDHLSFVERINLLSERQRNIANKYQVSAYTEAYELFAIFLIKEKGFHTLHYESYRLVAKRM